MTTRPVITGITVAPAIDAPIDVVDNPDRPTRWGWWTGRHLNVTAGPNRDAVYARARQVANRQRTDARIYADTGRGWNQVDTVPMPERELCEWWPDRDEPAVPGEGCADEATLSVGVSKNWHLCDSCADLPRFRRMSRRGRLAGYYKEES